ncbi:hypothetical protein IC757_03785 [Wenzhouxiangella sp. AB-CW3]|uniref:hypothetical protein n=1 Tax=Wenzhouxiangella sp. AB-CW3 TaxID=2771012 RepID=UPI00168AE9CC|nr:hypothetical protein [Wenzhouxiangella sp. AB-CW3]QOC23282.1 hypothetical protein IC757_03785 [Wenzhouxiangella sp. AB-CW3]
MKGSVITLVMLTLLLAACGSSQRHDDRQQAMDRWEALIRWSEYEALVDMIHPEWLTDNPIHPVELDRLEQFRVTEYRVRQVLVDHEGEGLERHARIRMYHIRSAQERVVDHIEVWRFDDDLNRWLLHSGLPDPSQS